MDIKWNGLMNKLHMRLGIAWTVNSVCELVIPEKTIALPKEKS